MFIRPGTTHLPAARITSAPAGSGVDPAGPTALMRSPSTITTASATGGPPFRSTTDAPTIATTRDGAGAWACAKGSGAGPTGCHDRIATSTPIRVRLRTHALMARLDVTLRM